MAFRGAKTALEEAVSEARQQELQARTRQLGLFEADGEADGEEPAVGGLARRGPGRPPGARGRRTDEAARIYMAEFGDPLRRGVAISALPILSAGVLEGLSKILGCDRHDAAKWWSSIYSATLPFIHQRLATLTVKPEGAPGGQPVRWTFSDDGQVDGEVVEMTPNAVTHEIERS